MEAVYFYKSNIEKDVKQILDTDEFMRISYETKITTLDDKRSGYFIYIIGSQEELNSLNTKLINIGAEQLSEQHSQIVIAVFKHEAENAASGMGLIFG